MLLLLPTDKNKLLLQLKGPLVVDTIVGVNDYGIVRLKRFVVCMVFIQDYIDIKELDSEISHTRTDLTVYVARLAEH